MKLWVFVGLANCIVYSSSSCAINGNFIPIRNNLLDWYFMFIPFSTSAQLAVVRRTNIDQHSRKNFYVLCIVI